MVCRVVLLGTTLFVVDTRGSFTSLYIIKFIMLVMKMEKESDEELAEKSADSKT